MGTLERAVAIAAEAHSGQLDKAGEPYVLHPLRIMQRLPDEAGRIVAVLHDVVEDCPGWTIERLRTEGFPEIVLSALDSVTKREGESYDAFVRRAADNPIGRRVKLADLQDNCDLSRISSPGPADHERIAKYRRAIAALQEIDP